jgi:V-type H+-transporting ATPase subunit A
MYKTMGMMKSIVKFYDNCLRIIEASAKSEKKISMGLIEQTLGADLIYELTQMKFKSPTAPEHEVRKYFDELHESIDAKFRDM